MFSEQDYRSWQLRLTAGKLFRRFWLLAGIYSVLAFCVIGLFLLPSITGRKIIVVALSAFIFGRFVVCELIYLVYKNQRPHQKYSFTQPKSWMLSWGTKRWDSFPSGHATSTAAISTVLFMYRPWLGIVGFLITLFTGMGRVVLGYHYTRDVIVGYVIGVISGLLAYYVLAPRLFTGL